MILKADIIRFYLISHIIYEVELIERYAKGKVGVAPIKIKNEAIAGIKLDVS